MRILLVEDHAALAEMSCRLLRDVYDYEVEHAPTGAAALEIFARWRPDLLLVDINLPDINGYRLARIVRSLPGSEGTLLVALSGFGNVIDDTTAGAAGFDAHFRKPMDFDLLATVRRRT